MKKQSLSITGILVEKGMHFFDLEPNMHKDIIMPRVWIVVADKNHSMIWRRGAGGFEKIMTADYKNASDISVCIEELLDWLDQALNEDVFERLILIAPRDILDMFRLKLSTNLTACIAAEIPKDYLRYNENDLEAELNKITVM